MAESKIDSVLLMMMYTMEVQWATHRSAVGSIFNLSLVDIYDAGLHAPKWKPQTQMQYIEVFPECLYLSQPTNRK